MKKIMGAFLALFLAASAGCDSQGTPGGPGATHADKKKLGLEDNSFTLATSALSVQQGETKETSITIHRGTNFDQDVHIAFADVPKGVTLTPASPVLKHGENEVKVKVQVGDEAALDNHKIVVKGSPEKGPPALNDFMLTVKKK